MFLIDENQKLIAVATDLERLYKEQLTLNASLY